jgi:predicted NAD/FAD-dependent oxidoreductase
VVSAAKETKHDLEIKVLQQAHELMRTLNANRAENTVLRLVQTVIEKRATFACTPQLHRPDANPFEGLTVCGDYVAGPYPATLEGAVISGCAAGQNVGSSSI